MIARLPRFAEYHVAALCADAGVICNKASEDELGWDFLLSFPAPAVPGRPADKRAGALEALVQVKSKRGPPLTARMKLSNALRAAQTRQPCFIVLVVEGEVGAPLVYARHIWESEIARSLKRVRLAENADDRLFNRRFLDIRLTEDDRRADLLGWMRRSIESVGREYGAEKKRLFDTLGHESGYGTLTVSVTGSHEEIVALMLGLRASVPVVRGQFVPERFGIAAAVPEFEVVEGEFEMSVPGQPGRLRLQGRAPSEALSVDATVYLSGLPGVPAERQGWRVDAGPLRIVGGVGGSAASITARYGERRSLADLNIFLAIAVWNGAGPVALTLFWNDTSMSLGTITMDLKGRLLDWQRLRKWGLTLEAVRAAAHADQPLLSVIDLDIAETMLDRFAGFVGSMLLRASHPVQPDETEIRAAVYYVGVDVGDYAFLAVLERPLRSDRREEGQRVLDFGAPQILEAMCRPGCWRDHQSDIAAAYEAQLERLGDRDTLWEMGEFEEFVARSAEVRRARAEASGEGDVAGADKAGEDGGANEDDNASEDYSADQGAEGKQR
jgi:hypothetical protein